MTACIEDRADSSGPAKRRVLPAKLVGSVQN
jgi:hypothetical protein